MTTFAGSISIDVLEFSTAADNPDSRVRTQAVTLWSVILHLHHTLPQVKVYTGSSILDLSIYIEDLRYYTLACTVNCNLVVVKSFPLSLLMKLFLPTMRRTVCPSYDLF
jgi:hypothetical protein